MNVGILNYVFRFVFQIILIASSNAYLVRTSFELKQFLRSNDEHG